MFCSLSFSFIFIFLGIPCRQTRPFFFVSTPVIKTLAEASPLLLLPPSLNTILKPRSCMESDLGVGEVVWLGNTSGLRICVLGLGATIARVVVPNKKGEEEDVVLGFQDLGDYKNNDFYFGCVVGRVCNRIEEGKFRLDERNYQLDINNHPNHLHGGLNGGWSGQIWQVVDKAWVAEGQREEATEEKVNVVVLEYVSEEGDGGYPGQVIAKVQYSLQTQTNTLQIDYWCESNTKTICSLTNHSYFHLNGHHSQEGEKMLTNTDNHILQLNSDKYLPISETFIPTGERRQVREEAKGEMAPFDFTSPKALCLPSGWKDSNPKHQHYQHLSQLQLANGFDHSFILDLPSSSLPPPLLPFLCRKAPSKPTTTDVKHVATVKGGGEGGIQMDVWTDRPAMQLYSSNFVDLDGKGLQHFSYKKRCAFCLETQAFPNAVNNPSFPSVCISPSHPFSSTTLYSFSISEESESTPLK